jgi:rod shape determining protein RodA
MVSSDRVFKVLISLLYFIVVIISAINMLSISQKLEELDIFYKHIFSLGLSIFSFVSGLIISNFRFRGFLFIFSIVLFIASFILSVHTKVAGLEVFGAKRWITIFGITFQPTEILKVASAISSAYFIALRREKFVLIFILAALNILPAFFIAAQPNVGSASVFFVIFLLSLLLSRISLRLIFLFFVVFSLMLPVIWKYGFKDYHRKRIQAFLNPESEYLSTGYQTLQSKIAISGGGLMGMGFAKGEHSKGKWLPNLHSDLAFVSIAEDFGFIGVFISLIFVFGFIFSLFFKAAFSDYRLSRIICALTGGIIAFHIVINLLMITGLFPVVGIPFTIISFAGTHNISISFLVGICAGISRARPRGIQESEFLLG